MCQFCYQKYLKSFQIHLSTYLLNQNTFLKQYHNNSPFQLNKKYINNMSHIIYKLYFEFYNYDIILVQVIV